MYIVFIVLFYLSLVNVVMIAPAGIEINADDPTPMYVRMVAARLYQQEKLKKQCLAKLLKDENVFLSGLIKQLRSENNLFRQRLHFPNSVAPLLRSLSLEYEPEKILHF